MTGLLVKDICLLLKRRTSILMLAAICVIVGVTIGDGFILGYSGLLGSILAVGTLSYDELDNGLAFLFTLPVSSRIYVIEKYLFIFAVTLCGWILGLILYFINSNAANRMSVIEISILIPLFMVMISLMIPLQLKFGIEKSRAVYALAMGAVFIISYCIRNRLGQGSLDTIVRTVDQMNPIVLAAAVWIAAVLFTAVSMWISIRILNHKEF